ncbi:hypothetical protein PRIPAC_73788 [Pristionchus pacificus]|uniref:Ribosomal protein n=1 Tax=Pristionchus pacificus TaxID=54126 RepID=A0A2A6C1R0_PRIPA|nr:hypothetical protein PRIPAC_73788 [Pristionchus pacificus]|eukprot:PDM72066.1 ribosomal protein [Pristionchus pacificus]
MSWVNSYAKASGSVIRKALKSLEPLKWVDKSEDGKGRVLSKQGRKDLDRIASGSVIRKALKSLEPLKWVDKSEDGRGRVLSKQGRKDLDRIAADLRSTVAPTDAVVFFVEFALCAELRARMPVSTTSAPSRRNTILPIEWSTSIDTRLGPQYDQYGLTEEKVADLDDSNDGILIFAGKLDALLFDTSSSSAEEPGYAEMATAETVK